MYRSATIDGDAITAFAVAGTLCFASHQNFTRTVRPAGVMLSTSPTLIPRIRTSDPGYTETARGKYAVAVTRSGFGHSVTALTARITTTTPIAISRDRALTFISRHLPGSPAGRESAPSAAGSPGPAPGSAGRCRTTARCRACW